MSDTLTAPAGGTALLERPQTFHGDPEVHHVVDQKDQNLMAAYVEGTPVHAICGEILIPTRDPGRFPLCSKCKAILDERGIAAPQV